MKETFFVIKDSREAIARLIAAFRGNNYGILRNFDIFFLAYRYQHENFCKKLIIIGE